MMPDDFNPNAREPVPRCCPECGFDPDEERRLEEALRAVIRAWENPGPMGTMMSLPRAISFAKSVLDPSTDETPVNPGSQPNTDKACNRNCGE